MTERADPVTDLVTREIPTERALAQSRVSYELPTARQVVGRGLQMAYDSTRDLRRASLYIGLCTAAVLGPFAVLLLVDIPKFAQLDFSGPEAMSRGQVALLAQLIGPLYGAGALGLLGFLTVEIDGLLIAVALLAGRAAGRPLDLREALARARQVFWRYGVAAFVVGLISTVVTFAILFALGAFQGTASLGASLTASFISTLIVLPFGYVATAVVIGDVTGGAALRRSVVLVRARFRLAFAVAAFAFVASALQTFGLGIATDVVGLAAEVLHPNLDLAGPGLFVAVPLVFIALMALGSLSLTVDAVTLAPQVAAFLGLTRYSGGIDRARRPTPQDAPLTDGTVAMDAMAAMDAIDAGGHAETDGSAEADRRMQADPRAEADRPVEVNDELTGDPDIGPRPEPESVDPPASEPTSPGAARSVRRTRPVRVRWVTVPMLALIGLETLIVVLALLRS